MFQQSGLWLARLALVLSVLVFVQTSRAADSYFGNFEDDVMFNGQYILDKTAEGYAGWFDWDYQVETRPPLNMNPSTTIGVTTGTNSIAYQPYSGFDQGLAVHLQDLPAATRSAAFDALLTHTQLAMNVTWDNDEWTLQYQGDGWNGAKVELNINFGPNGGYHGLGVPTIDTGNPTNQGLWDLTNYPSVHNRVVTWDYSQYLPEIQALVDANTLSATDGYVEFMLQTTIGNFATPVTYYIDGWRFTGDIVSEGLTGDYNDNGVIDAADYTTWRDVMTAGTGTLTNDPTPGTVDETDFDYWRAHFGEGSGGGAGVASAAVPEPTSALLALLAVGTVGLLRRKLR
jgi:PEP-CTERM motif